MGKIIENYSIQEQLGEGVYGKVYKAVHIKTKQQVAIKVIHADKFKQIPKLEECTVNQINILSTIQSCPYIVKYIDMLKTVNNFYFVYEFCNGGTLDKLMQKEGPFSQKRALIYFRQMVQAFKLLSKNNIMHRDLKPDNILMHNGIIKLGDFGFCKPLQSAMQMANTMLGSPIYMAPQVLKGQTYNMKADIWSLGVVLFQMLFGRCPFESKSIAKLIKLLDEQDLKIPQNPRISPTVQKLIRRMLVKDYNSRIQWNQLFQYTITESGQIFFGKNNPQMNQFQLRSSIKSSSNFGMFSTNSVYSTSTSSSSGQLNTGNMLSPKINKSFEPVLDDKNILMKKRSPMKHDTDISLATSSQYKAYSKSDYKNQMSYTKNTRIDMLIKNHGKVIIINQIVFDCLDTKLKNHQKRIPIAYLLFKSLEKQLFSITDSLRKQINDARYDQFRNIVDREVDMMKEIINCFRTTINQDDLQPVVGNMEQPNKPRIMKNFYENTSINTEDQIILAAQIVDFLDEGMLIRRQSYEKMGKETLIRQVKNKFMKYL